LRVILNNAVEAAQPLFEASKHAFSLSMPAEPVYLEGDPTRLAQVFLNILANAAKYTPKRGAIALSVEVQARQVRVRIRDNGVGLEPETIPQMFEMFVQGHRTGDHVQGGLGIGLSLSKQLLDLHGGTIQAQSEGLGYGSEFIVNLPLTPAHEPVDSLMAATPSRLDGGRRVLIVDDNVDAADTLAASLEFVGHQVKARYSGPSALEEAAQWKPEVAILDIGMPDMDGYEVARRLRLLQPDVFMIALTGWGQESDLRRAEEAGFDMHRTKPVNLQELMAKIALPPKVLVT
jgi:CheY-like chemotaxis protein